VEVWRSRVSALLDVANGVDRMNGVPTHALANAINREVLLRLPEPAHGYVARKAAFWLRSQAAPRVRGRRLPPATGNR
jgi:hypothetical protein